MAAAASAAADTTASPKALAMGRSETFDPAVMSKLLVAESTYRMRNHKVKFQCTQYFRLKCKLEDVNISDVGHLQDDDDDGKKPYASSSRRTTAAAATSPMQPSMRPTLQQLVTASSIHNTLTRTWVDWYGSAHRDMAIVVDTSRVPLKTVAHSIEEAVAAFCADRAHFELVSVQQQFVLVQHLIEHTKRLMMNTTTPVASAVNIGTAGACAGLSGATILAADSRDTVTAAAAGAAAAAGETVMDRLLKQARPGVAPAATPPLATPPQAAAAAAATAVPESRLREVLKQYSKIPKRGASSPTHHAPYHLLDEALETFTSNARQALVRSINTLHKQTSAAHTKNMETFVEEHLQVPACGSKADRGGHVVQLKDTADSRLVCIVCNSTFSKPTDEFEDDNTVVLHRAVLRLLFVSWLLECMDIPFVLDTTFVSMRLSMDSFDTLLHPFLAQCAASTGRAHHSKKLEQLYVVRLRTRSTFERAKRIQQVWRSGTTGRRKAGGVQACGGAGAGAGAGACVAAEPATTPPHVAHIQAHAAASVSHILASDGKAGRKRPHGAQ